MSRQKQKGFTLIELLVVVAIIGILSSIVITSLNSARVKARVAGAQTALRAMVPHLSMCLGDGGTFYVDTTTAVTAGVLICGTGSAAFPELPDGWAYGPNVLTPSGSEGFGALGDGKTVRCTESGCVTTDTP